MRIFISYSSKDGSVYAKKLFEVLFKRGHDPYLFDHGCVSEIIWDEIAEEIGNRELSIFLVTESSQQSKGQKQEYDLVVAKYKKRMAFEIEKASEMKILDKTFPFLYPYRGLVFNDENLEEKCETISTQLVKLQDKESSVQKEEIDQEEKGFPELTLEGLDEGEVAKCIDNLFDSYQKETVIPDAFRTNEAGKSEKLVNLGFNYRLPREWFFSYDVTHTIYSNDFMFRQFGRSIALGERKYLNDQVMRPHRLQVEGRGISEKDLLEEIDAAISVISANGFKPTIIFPTINHMMKMHALSRANIKAHLKYSNITPRPTLDSSLIINGTELKVISPLGKIPTNTIVFGDGAIRWLVKRHPRYGSLYIDMGNDRLYPKKYVQVITMTTIRCEIDPKAIVVIKTENDAAEAS